MPGEQSQFQGSLVGHAAGPGLAGEDQAGDAGRIDAVVACLANLGVAASVGLEGIEDDGVIAAALEFCPRAHPVVAGGFHGNQHPAGSTGGAEHLVFQPIEALTRIGKGRQLGDDLALGRDGRGGMGSLADVDADDGPALSQHGPSRTGVVHDSDSWERFCQRARAHRGGSIGEEDLRIKHLIQNLVGYAGRPARNWSQPTHAWRSGDLSEKTRVTFFSPKRTSGGQAWRPASKVKGFEDADVKPGSLARSRSARVGRRATRCPSAVGPRGPDKSHRVHIPTRADRQSGPGRTVVSGHPTACHVRSRARCVRCDRAANRKVRGDRRPRSKTGTGRCPPVPDVRGIPRCGGDGRSRRTTLVLGELSAA